MLSPCRSLSLLTVLFIVSSLDAAVRHPCLVADASDIEQAKAWMRQSEWYRSLVEEHRTEIDEFLSHRPVFVSPIKQTYQYKPYLCPTHDVDLLYEVGRPHRHRCPIDTLEIFTGGKYDAAWAGWYNRLVAGHLVWMGILYQLYDDEKYAEAGKEIVMQFTDLYLRYPTANTILGPAHVFFGTLSESFWGVDMAYGYDLLYNYRGFTPADHARIRDSLFLPLATITQQFPESASNRQLWYNNVSAAVGFLYGDTSLVHFAIDGTYGFNWQLGSALPQSGFWAEWSGYHFVALRGMIHLAEMARHNGLDLYHRTVAGRSMKSMFDAPFDCILPNFEFPRIVDSGGGNLLEYTVFYEVGYAVYRDPRYLSLLHHSMVQRGTQVVAEESGLGRTRSPITIFTMAPVLPPGRAPLYSNHGVNLAGNGFAILRNGSENDRRYAYLYYGIMGGEHGHPERLQIGYYARGHNWLVDPLNEMYFNPNLQLWYRQTIAHNTIVVDQTSQTWANGEGRFYGELPSLQVASGGSTTVYPGATLVRTLCQIDDYLLDVFDVSSPDTRMFDWALHGSGAVTLDGVAMKNEPRDRFGNEPGIPGYDQFREIRSGVTDGGWTATFGTNDGEHLSVHAIGEPGTRVFTAMTPPLGGFYKQMVKDRSPLPMIISRRVTRATRFAHVIHAFGNAPDITGVQRRDGLYIVQRRAGSDRVAIDDDRRTYSIVRRERGRVALCALLNGSTLADSGTTLVSSPNLLQGIECRWHGTRLSVVLTGPAVNVAVWGPAIDSVVVNNEQVPFRRVNSTVVFSTARRPFLEIHPSSDTVVFAGTSATLHARVWNPGPQQASVSVAMAPDWRERVQSERDWWGGIVNLLPLSKNALRHITVPASLRIDDAWLLRCSSTRTPGTGFTDVALDLTVPPDIQPGSYPVVFGFSGEERNSSVVVEAPLSFSVSLRNGPGPVIRLVARNTTPIARQVDLSLVSSPGLALAGTSSWHVLIPADSVFVGDVSCRVHASSGNRAFTVTASGATERYQTACVRDLAVTISHRATERVSLDGSWEGWNTVSPAMIDSSNQRCRLLLGNQPWGGKDDLSAVIYSMYDREYLYVGADVRDDSLVTEWNFPVMSYPWDTDCMEVVLDTRQGADQGTDPPTPGLFRHLSMAEYRRTEFEASLWRGGGAGGPLLPKPLLVPDAETFFTRKAHGYALICRYPLTRIGVVPRPGYKIGFDVAISDNDGTTYRKNMHIWSGYTQNQTWWDTGTIGALIFGE